MVPQLAQICVLLVSLTAQASPPPLSDEAVAAMVRSVRESENWIHEVDGLLIRFEGGWTRSPKSIALKRKQLAGFAVDGRLDPNLHPGLKPKTTETLEFERTHVHSGGHPGCDHH